MKKTLLFIGFAFLGMQSYAQVGINTTTPDPSSVLDVKSDDKGLLIPRVTLNSNTHQLSTATNAVSLLVYNMGSTDVPKGFYNWDGSKWNQLLDSSTTEAATTGPKFFYMPSVVLPTLSGDSLIGTGSTANYTYEASTQTFKVNIYNLFSNQFTTPIAASSVGANLTEFVKTADKYSYFVTHADPNLFTNIAISATGVLSYKVNSAAIIKSSSFMNIVLKVN